MITVVPGTTVSFFDPTNNWFPYLAILFGILGVVTWRNRKTYQAPDMIQQLLQILSIFSTAFVLLFVIG